MNEDKKYNYLVFLISATSTFTVSFLGLVAVSELILLAILPWLIINDKKKSYSFNINFRSTVLMLLVWFLSVVISDLYNATPLSKFYKGIGQPLMIFVSFWSLCLLLKNSRSFFKYFLIGNIVSAIVNIFTNQVAAENFRFGLFKVLTAIVFFVMYSIWTSHRKKNVYYLFLILAIIGFVSGGRSNGLIILIAVFILYYAETNRIKTTVSKSKIFKILLLTVVVGWITQELYVFSVKSKLFPRDYQEKFESQLATGLPVILSGRTEFFGSSQAIIDSPIFGHGSWASNPKYLIIVLNKTFVTDEARREYLVETRGSSKIPSHSFIFGEWVEHGILGMIFFLFFGQRLFRLLLYILENSKKPEIPFLTYVLITYAWHLFFSPIGAEKRLFIVLILCLNASFVYSRLRKKL